MNIQESAFLTGDDTSEKIQPEQDTSTAGGVALDADTLGQDNRNHIQTISRSDLAYQRDLRALSSFVRTSTPITHTLDEDEIPLSA